MKVIHKIKIHLDDNRMLQPVEVMQGDANTRLLEFSLYAEGKEWTVPANVSVSVAYFGASGRGAYDTLPDGSAAYTVNGNVVQATLIQQVTAVFGTTTVTVVFTDGTGKQLAAFGVPVKVERNAAVGAGKPQNYYNLREWVSAGPLHISIEAKDGGWFADRDYDEIRQEQEASREIVCHLALNGGEDLELRLIQATPAALSFGAVVAGVEWQAVISRAENGASVVEVTSTACGKEPLYVTLGAENGAYVADRTFADIRAAYDQKRSVYCMAGTMLLPLAGVSSTSFMFSAANKNRIFRVTIQANGTVNHETYLCALAEDVPPAATDEIYFDITADGVISLKPEYRGASPSDTANYTYALSDNGKGRDGSQNKELPEEIVIPETVRGIPVTAYAYAMFINNKRVKRLVLLPGVKVLPGYFCYGTWNLEAVTGTENVETLDKYAFATSGIRAANFPALKTFSSAYQFRRCTNLAVADLGGVVTEIPARCFEGCEKLYEIRNGQSIRKIGECGLYFTLRLKQLPFLPSVTEISDCGLLVSRVDVSQVSSDCKVGTWSTAKAFYGEDYWTEPGKNATPCNTPLRSIFHQDDPRWVDKTIGNTGRTWDKGCMPVCAAMAYSIFEDRDLASPEEFTDAVYAADPSLKDADPAEWGNIERYFEAVGYTATKYTPFNAANLQVMYDALATGAVVIHRCFAGAIKSAEGWLDDNHLVLIHGINAEGEVLCVDPAAPNEALGVYEGITYAMPIQNRTRAAEGTEKDCFWIVRKN